MSGSCNYTITYIISRSSYVTQQQTNEMSLMAGITITYIYK
jgi:hypothetical protein